MNNRSGKRGQDKTSVRVENVSKIYQIYDHPRDRLIQSLWGRDRRCKPKKFYREFWALQNISFELGSGQTLGIVGRNGSGKSTLLQLICGTLKPTAGEIMVAGRIGALLELGSGFNPEFTGLENIYLNASLLGLTRIETEKKLDQILSFADIGDFAFQPVKTYSSGMAVRLAFAVQAHTDPEILVVDEALAVGDELFQKKCYAHLEKIKEQGTSVLLVTHSSAQIMQHCDQALLLHKGKAQLLGYPARIVVFYQRILNCTDQSEVHDISNSIARSQNLELLSGSGEDSLSANTADTNRPRIDEKSNNDTAMQCITAFFDHNLMPQSTEIYPLKGGKILNAEIISEDGKSVNVLPFGQDFTLVFEYEALEDLKAVATSCFIASHTGQGITGQSFPANMGARGNGYIPTVAAGHRWKADYHFRGLLWPGIYLISGAFVSFDQGNKRFVHRVIDFKALRILDEANISPLGACSLSKFKASIVDIAG